MTTKVEKELDDKIKKENKSIVQIASSATKIAVIKTDKDLTSAIDFLVRVKKKLKEGEEERLSYTKPINESLSRLNARFKELSGPLKEAERSVKDGILVYRKIKEDQRSKDEADLIKKNGNADITLADRVPDIMESKTGEIRTRKTWTFKVVDMKKVTRDWLVVDERKVKEAIKGGERNIKGLEIYQEEDLSTY